MDEIAEAHRPVRLHDKRNPSVLISEYDRLEGH